MGWIMKLDKNSYNLMIGFNMHSNEFGNEAGGFGDNDTHDFSTLDDSDKEYIADSLYLKI